MVLWVKGLVAKSESPESIVPEEKLFQKLSSDFYSCVTVLPSPTHKIQNIYKDVYDVNMEQTVMV